MPYSRKSRLSRRRCFVRCANCSTGSLERFPFWERWKDSTMHAKEFDVIPGDDGTEDLMTAKPFAAPAPTTPLNVLVIDDEKSIRDSCRQAAEALGFKTHVAENAGNAFKTLEV